MALWQTVISLGLLLNMVGIAVSIIVAFKRKPPVAEQMHQLFATRPEFNEAVLRIHKRIDHTNTDIQQTNEKLAKAFGDMERAIGRLEGQLDKSEHAKSR